MTELQPGQPWADAVRQAAATLYNAGASAVWLFGSRTRPETFDRLSDFDLAVEGLPNGAQAITRASSQLWGRVDIVPLESAAPALRWSIVRDRILVPLVPQIPSTSTSRPLVPDTLAGARIRAAVELFQDAGVRSIIDFGCGYGLLLAELATDKRFDRLTGVDFNSKSLIEARQRITRLVRLRSRNRIHLHEGLITHRNPLYLGHDAAAAIEVIEHLDAPQLNAFVGVVFEFVRPARVILTTPNIEYNVLWFGRHPRGYRHADHRFEWSRHQFIEWASELGTTYRYDVRMEGVGTSHPDLGPPTQLSVFDRRD